MIYRAFLATACFLLVSIIPCAAGARTAPTLEKMLGQMILIGFRGTGETASDLATVLEDVRQGKIGGVILFEPDYLTGQRRNIVSLEQVRRLTGLLQDEAAIPLFVGVDQEGGRVARFRPEHGVAELPAAREMGLMEPKEIFRLAARLGDDLIEAGVNLDFAPVVDLDRNPDSPAIGRAGRSFGGDAAAVARKAGAFAAGLRSRGVIYCLKHFPGHGSAGADSHAGFTDISDTWSEEELVPYRRLLSPGEPCMVMSGHVTLRRYDAEHPASLSRRITTGLLRKELGWEGVVVTDDLQMRAVLAGHGLKEAIALAVNAGADVLLVGNNLEHDPELGRKVHALLVELVEEGTIDPERVTESYARILSLKRHLMPKA